MQVNVIHEFLIPCVEHGCRYQKCSKISERKFREILRYFAQDFTASDTSKLSSVSVRSVNTTFLKLRNRIAQECENQTPFKGVVELDESYFGPRRIRGKRGRGASGKTIVLASLKEATKYIQKLSRMPQKLLLSRS